MANNFISIFSTLFTRFTLQNVKMYACFIYAYMHICKIHAYMQVFSEVFI